MNEAFYIPLVYMQYFPTLFLSRLPFTGMVLCCHGTSRRCSVKRLNSTSWPHLTLLHKWRQFFTAVGTHCS